MTKYIVQIKINLTAGSTIWTGRGSTQRLMSEDAFDTEAEALMFYKSRKSTFRFCGGGHYATYPVKVENYQPTHIHDKFCDSCGEGIEESNDTYTEIHGGDYCSKSCLNSGSHSDDDDSHCEEQYSDDY